MNLLYNSWCFLIYFLLFSRILIFHVFGKVFPCITWYFIVFPVWHFIYPSKKSKIVQDPVNKKNQVEQESCKNIKVFHVFNKVFPSISCFWFCISYYFVVFPEIYRYFLIFWNFLVFSDISWYFLMKMYVFSSVLPG
jgi:hypothetical protein